MRPHCAKCKKCARTAPNSKKCGSCGKTQKVRDLCAAHNIIFLQGVHNEHVQGILSKSKTYIFIIFVPALPQQRLILPELRSNSGRLK